MKKKILSVALVLTMAVAMTTACGSKDKGGNKVTVTVDEVQDKMTEAIKEVDSVAMDLNVTVGVDAEGEDASQNMEVDLGFKAEGKATIGTPAGYVKYSGDMKLKGETENVDNKLSGEAYVVTEGESGTLYYNTNDEGWYTGTATLEDIMSEMESALSDYGMTMDDILSSATAEGAVTETQKPVLSSKTVEAEDKECYELVVKMDKNMLAESEEAATYAEMFDTFEGIMKMYIDVDTNLPVKFVYDMDIKMDVYGITVNLDEFEITMTADYNNVEAIEVPSDVKDSAIEL